MIERINKALGNAMRKFVGDFSGQNRLAPESRKVQFSVIIAVEHGG
jgi:hypothetical protein